jgi:hypothetical protein
MCSASETVPPVLRAGRPGASVWFRKAWPCALDNWSLRNGLSQLMETIGHSHTAGETNSHSPQCPQVWSCDSMWVVDAGPPAPLHRWNRWNQRPSHLAGHTERLQTPLTSHIPHHHHFLPFWFLKSSQGPRGTVSRAPAYQAQSPVLKK